MRRRDFFKRSQQRHYASHSHENPYFRKQGRERRARLFLLFIAPCFLIFIFLSLLFAHPLFNITSVLIKGTQQIDRNALASTVKQFIGKRKLLFFHEQNRFLFDADEFIDTLYKQFTFRDVQIKRKGSHIDLYVVERTSQLIWSTQSSIYVVDLDGIVIRTLTDEEAVQLKNIGMPLFVDRNDVKIQIGQHVLTKLEIEETFRFHEHLRAQHIEFTQTEFDRLAGKWVGVLTKDGYRILFDTSTDIDVQAQRLDLVLKEKVKDVAKLEYLEYIDLRFGDHVYFK